MADNSPALPVVEDRNADSAQWWGYSEEHGWVVLDRRLLSNAPGIKVDLLFLRCRDVTVFELKRELWRPPRFRFAPIYIRELAPAARDVAVGELSGYQDRWAEFESEIQRASGEIEAREEAARVEQERARKQAASEKRKAAAAQRAQAAAAAKS